MATWKEKYNKKYQYKKNKSHNLSDISKDTGVSRSGLQKIYNKGIGAYKTNPQSVRPNVTSKEQWAMARVYSSVMGGKASKIDKKELNMEKGGSTDFNPDGKIKDKIVHASGDAGGMLVGKRHSNGGIKALNKSTGQPLEMEGGEVVITRNAVSDNKKRSFNGKMLTNRQILSEINESGGGVSFADGGKVPNDVKFDCNAEYEYGGKTMCGKDLAYALGGVTTAIVTDPNEAMADLQSTYGFGDVYAKGGIVWKKNIGDEGWSSTMESNNAYENEGGYISEDGNWKIYRLGDFYKRDWGDNYERRGLWTVEYKNKSIGYRGSSEPMYLSTLKDAKEFVSQINNEKFAKGGEVNEAYVDFMNKDKGFKVERKYFKTYQDAEKWARSEFERFNPDMISYTEYETPLRSYDEGGTIECGSCDWSWDEKDGGDDVYVCHKCGTDNTNEYKNGGITINNNNMKKNNLIKPKRKGKNIMTLAKEIRKKDESWQDALKRAKIEMNKTSSKKSSNIDSELGKLKELIKEDEILKEYNYSKKNTKKSNTRLQKGGDVMSLGIANADAVYNKGGEIDNMTFGELYDYLRDKDEGYWDNVNSEEIVRMYIDDMNNEGVNVSHIEEVLENNPSRQELYEIWLGNSMETPTPINTKEDLLEALELDKKDYAKGGKLSKDDAITKALKLGVDFNKDFHSQSFGNELSELAKETGYRKSKSSSGSLGRSFFNHLQKIYDKNSSYYNSTLNSRGYAKGGEIETKREFVEVVNQVKEENEALPNDFVNVMDSINAILQDRGYEEDDEYTYDVRQEILDRYEEKVLDKQGLRFAKGGSLKEKLAQYERDKKKMQEQYKKGEYKSEEWFGKNKKYAKGGKFADGGRVANYKNSVELYYNDGRKDSTSGVSTKYDKFLLVSENRLDEIKSTDNYSDGFWQYPNKDIPPVPVLVLQKNERSNDLYAVPLKNYEAKDIMEFGGNYVGEYFLGAIGLFDRRNLSGRGADDISSYNQGTPRYAKGGKTDDKGRKYADGGTIGEYPRVYIADLEAYNNGELKGEWLDLADYNDSEEFNDAVQDLLDGWGVEEYAIHDVENFPDGMYSEYMGTSDFDEIYDMIELAKNNDLPLDVVMEVVSQYDESAVEEYQGQYEDGEDFASQLIDDIGLESFNDPQYFVDISDMDRRIMAQEMADSYTDDIAYEDDGERVVEEAGLDVDEYRELDGEDDDKRDEILEEAKEIVRDEYYETWYDGLDDPYEFLVNEQGLYSDEDFFKANFIQIDYGELANALEQDYLFIENDKGLFVFNVR